MLETFPTEGYGSWAEWELRRSRLKEHDQGAVMGIVCPANQANQGGSICKCGGECRVRRDEYFQRFPIPILHNVEHSKGVEIMAQRVDAPS